MLTLILILILIALLFSVIVPVVYAQPVPKCPEGSVWEEAFRQCQFGSGMTVPPIGGYPNPNVTNAINALEGQKECPMLPSSEAAGPVPQMNCHDPECQEYLFSGNATKNATMEKRCWTIQNNTLGSLAANN